MIYQTAIECGQIANIASKTVYKWGQEGKVAKDGNLFNLVDVLKVSLEWHKSEVERLRKQIDEKEDRLYLAKCAKLEAETRMKELEIDEKRGNLVVAVEVEKEWSNLVVRTKCKLLALPARLSAELAGINEPILVRNRLAMVVDEALRELAGI